MTVLGSLADVRLDQPPPSGAGAAALTAARNEVESFQVAISPRRAGQVKVAPAGPLLGPGNAAIPAADVAVYREVGYAIGAPDGPPASYSGGEPGIYPDALIPARDELYGERRDAFPVEVGAGEEVVAWVDVNVPLHAPAGRYRGAVEVTGPAGAAPGCR